MRMLRPRREGFAPCGAAAFCDQVREGVTGTTTRGGDRKYTAFRQVYARRTPRIMPLTAPDEQVQDATLVRLDDGFQLGGVDRGVPIERIALEANDKVEVGLDVGLGCGGVRGDAEDVQGLLGRVRL